MKPSHNGGKNESGADVDASVPLPSRDFRMKLLRFLYSLALAITLGTSILIRSQPTESRKTRPNETLPGESLTSRFLKHEIAGSNVPLADVQAFLEARVPKLRGASNSTDWRQEADALRQRMLKQVVFRGHAAEWREVQTGVEWLETIEGSEGYRIKKLRYEALPGMWIPALLYEPTNLSGKVPVILNVNGHDRNGKAAPYKQIRCINQVKRGMLALNVEWLNMGQLRGPGFDHYRMNQLDLCGTSGIAPFYLAMTRALDLLLSLEHADPSRVGVAGLSGGGWQTIFVSALDTRVTLCNPVAGYSSFLTRVRNVSDLGDSEQTPTDMATVADYSHLTAMLAPRPALLTFNAKDDCCFAADHALPPLLEAAGPIYTLLGKENNLRSHTNYDPGTHNFEIENREQLYRLIGDHFFSRDTEYDWREIESSDEVKSAEELAIDLPSSNADFNSIAVGLSNGLPRNANLPTDPVGAKRWQRNRRLALHQIVRTKNYTVRPERTGSEEANGLTAIFWRLRLSGVWTVPVVEIFRGKPEATTILVSDLGRTNAADQAERLLALGNRVLAVDPFYFGENKIKSRDFLFALLTAAVGERPLGIQASQLTAIARWSQSEHRTGPVAVIALGPRSSLFTLVAAALEEQVIDGVELYGSLGSLKEIIEQNWGVNEKPELFCFGLLEAFDIKQLVALASPIPVVFPDASPRVRTELSGIQKWYRQLGVDEYRPW